MMHKLFCDDCGAEIKTGDIYYSGQVYEDDYFDTVCQACFDEERKSWSLPISFTPGGRMLLWGWAFSWLKTSFWRLMR